MSQVKIRSDLKKFWSHQDSGSDNTLFTKINSIEITISHYGQIINAATY